MDDPHVRQQLMQYLRQSESTHVEFGGYIYWDKMLMTYLVASMPLAPPNAPNECHFTHGLPIPQDSIDVAVRGWHTHPLPAGRLFTHWPDYEPGSRAVRGPSDLDKKAVDKTALPELIVDPNEAWVLFPKSQGRSLISKPWNTKACLPWS